MKPTTISSLVLREVLQHRNTWAWSMGVPPVLATLGIAFGRVDADRTSLADIGTSFPVALAAATVTGSTFVMLAVMLIGSLVILSGLPRRDHGDRSVEFWLSLPTSHPTHFAVPLVVHLLLAPAAAIVIGWLVGWVLAVPLLMRAVGPEGWSLQTLGTLMPAAGALLLRLLSGLPLAILWVLPLLMAVAMLNALVGRWAVGLFVLIVYMGGLLLWQLIGDPVLPDLVEAQLAHAATSLIGASGGLVVKDGAEAFAALARLPAWLLGDFRQALADAGSARLLGGLVLTAVCFWGLVQWRRRGAMA